MRKEYKLEAKPDYQRWNEDEFNGDIFVARVMAPVQRWMYRTLLQAAFFHSTRPYLPNDDEMLWVLAGCESKQQWLDNKDVVLKRFTAVEDKPDLLENKRITEDWNHLVSKRKKLRANGKEPKRRREQEEANAKQMLPNAKQMPTNCQGSNSNSNSKSDRKRKRGEGEVSRTSSSATKPAPPSPSQDSENQQPMAEQEMSVELKRFCKLVIPIWKEIFGQSAVLNLPDKSKDRLEFLTETNDYDLLEKAFRLFAQDCFDNGRHDPWAIGKFASRAGEYMQRVQPLNVSTAQEDANKAAAARDTKNAPKLADVIKSTETSAPEKLAGSVEDYFDKE